MTAKFGSRAYLKGYMNRWFGNREYEYAGTYFSKEKAIESANRFKKNGYYTRIVSSYKGYADEEHKVYVSNKILARKR